MGSFLAMSDGLVFTNARNVLSYQDTDADMIRFELTPVGLQLTVNGECLHSSWRQLRWVSWDASARKLIDPSNEGSVIPADVDMCSLARLAVRADPRCEWRGDRIKLGDSEHIYTAQELRELQEHELQECNDNGAGVSTAAPVYTLDPTPVEDFAQL